ncbi:hypothetical protein PENSPDRAFT_692762 [Peniophora sp. CONT]|nr:hypothetical protein PENSPDRAFT_692762 [Peniophora sp. CONT]
MVCAGITLCVVRRAFYNIPAFNRPGDVLNYIREELGTPRERGHHLHIDVVNDRGKPENLMLQNIRRTIAQSRTHAGVQLVVTVCQLAAPAPRSKKAPAPPPKKPVNHRKNNPPRSREHAARSTRPGSGSLSAGRFPGVPPTSTNAREQRTLVTPPLPTQPATALQVAPSSPVEQSNTMQSIMDIVAQHWTHYTASPSAFNVAVASLLQAGQTLQSPLDPPPDSDEETSAQQTFRTTVQFFVTVWSCYASTGHFPVRSEAYFPKMIDDLRLLSPRLISSIIAGVEKTRNPWHALLAVDERPIPVPAPRQSASGSLNEELRDRVDALMDEDKDDPIAPVPSSVLSLDRVNALMDEDKDDPIAPVPSSDLSLSGQLDVSMEQAPVPAPSSVQAAPEPTPDPLSVLGEERVPKPPGWQCVDRAAPHRDLLARVDGRILSFERAGADPRRIRLERATLEIFFVPNNLSFIFLDASLVNRAVIKLFIRRPQDAAEMIRAFRSHGVEVLSTSFSSLDLLTHKQVVHCPDRASPVPITRESSPRPQVSPTPYASSPPPPAEDSPSPANTPRWDPASPCPDTPVSEEHASVDGQSRAAVDESDDSSSSYDPREDLEDSDHSQPSAAGDISPGHGTTSDGEDDERPISPDRTRKKPLRCGRCHQFGHMRTNHKCPLWDSSESTPKKPPRCKTCGKLGHKKGSDTCKGRAPSKHRQTVLDQYQHNQGDSGDSS